MSKYVCVGFVVSMLCVSVCTAQEPTVSPSSPQEDSKPPDSQPQSGHEYQSNVTSDVTAPVSEGGTQQQGAQRSKGEPSPLGKKRHREDPWVPRLSVIISLISAGVAGWSLFLTRRTVKVTERAYLTTESLNFKGDIVFCFVTNKGRTPATLQTGYTEYVIKQGGVPLPPPGHYFRVDRDFMGASLPAQGSFPVKIGSLSINERREAQDSSTYSLEITVYVKYLDGFRKQQTMHSVMEFDREVDGFAVAHTKRITTEKQNN